MPLDNNNPPTDEPITPTVAAYSIAQVATHNTAANCWIVLDGKVYNVTEWISKHPGGARAITSRCGTDASRAFANVGHSSSADDIRATYFIGNLAQ
jgi:cytochrome b involved in lipid metabolism